MSAATGLESFLARSSASSAAWQASDARMPQGAQRPTLRTRISNVGFGIMLPLSCRLRRAPSVPASAVPLGKSGTRPESNDASPAAGTAAALPDPRCAAVRPVRPAAGRRAEGTRRDRRLARPGAEPAGAVPAHAAAPPTSEELQGWSKAGCARRSSIARVSRWAWTATTRSCGAGSAQKLEFIADGATPTPPSAAELQAWLDAHADKYQIEPRYTLTQIYFDAGAARREARRRCGRRASRARCRQDAGRRSDLVAAGCWTRPRVRSEAGFRQGVRRRAEGLARRRAGRDRCARASACTW